MMSGLVGIAALGIGHVQLVLNFICLGGIRWPRPRLNSEGFWIGESSRVWKRQELEYSSGMSADAIAGIPIDSYIDSIDR